MSSSAIRLRWRANNVFSPLVSQLHPTYFSSYEMSNSSNVQAQYRQYDLGNNDFDNSGESLDWNSILSTLDPTTLVAPHDFSAVATPLPTPTNLMHDPIIDCPLPRDFSLIPNPFGPRPFLDVASSTSTPESSFVNWLSTELALPSDETHSVPSFPLFPSSLSPYRSLEDPNEDHRRPGWSAVGSKRSVKVVSPSELELEDKKTREGSTGDERDKRRRNTEASGTLSSFPFLLSRLCFAANTS